MREFSEKHRRAINVATIISLLLLGCILVLGAAAPWLNPWRHRLSLGSGFHIALWGAPLNPRLVFFNDSDYGPYRGSIIGIVDDQGNMYPPLEREIAFGDTLGIYYRYFRWSDATLWTLMVTLWYPAIAFAVLPLLWWYRRARPKPGCCRKCGYNLTGNVSGRCPECGLET
ncbi:MAG: hypothetical protein JXA69_11015 [Phycisphaerae bacterium]|nr:hypothetical protein [Phycisphaerae bacterium]